MSQHLYAKLDQLASITNQRQARRIMDIPDDAALVLRHSDGREQWVINSAEGLYCVCYNQGTLYFNDTVSVGMVSGMAAGAESHDVVHENLPLAVYERPRGER